MTVDLHPWALELSSLHAQAWHRLIRGVHDRRAPARHPTLATVSSQGWPQARTVVLRAADRSNARLEIHTHSLSPKVGELAAMPVAALHVWDPGSRLQIRIQAEVEIVQGHRAASTWACIPQRSQAAYRCSTVPGQALPTTLANEPQPDCAYFAVLCLTIRLMDLLHLGPDHRRATFHPGDGWAGQWVAP